MKRILLILILWIITGFAQNFQPQNIAAKSAAIPFKIQKIDQWYLDKIHIPQGLTSKRSEPIIIAVVDDGFRLSHQDLANYWYKNSHETAGNLFDDDGNGFDDDIIGWDISDADNDVSVPEKRLDTFYHGTYISGIIVSILERAFGPNASNYFKILPIKTLADDAVYTYLKDGYLGINYALKSNADIINCSWSGNRCTDSEKQILNHSTDHNSIIIGSAGNFSALSEVYPASHKNVIAVGALDSNNYKVPRMNFGEFLDISAPGADICGAGVLNDTSYVTTNGTSAATAIISACTAIIVSQLQENDFQKVKFALKNGANEIETINKKFAGKLGAGIVNLEKSLKILNYYYGNHYTELPEGRISYQKTKLKNYEWLINPQGDYQGIQFRLIDIVGKASNAQLDFYKINNIDDFTKEKAGTLNLSEFPQKYQVKGHPVFIKFSSEKSSSKLRWDLEYSVIPIDSTTLYCDGTEILELPEDEISDGSGPEKYANNCSCKWQINAPEGHKISLEFLEMDTQPAVDYVYIFEGNATIPKNMIGKFSGKTLPPKIISATNQVLIWFVTDSEITEDGWLIFYKF